MKYWLIVERYENWLVDQSEGFSRFGLPERKKPIADQIKKNDVLVVYVSSGMSALSDARLVTEDGASLLGRSGNYDMAYPIRADALVKRDSYLRTQPTKSNIASIDDAEARNANAAG